MPALELLNSIRSVAGDEYASRIPEATRQNIATVGNTILAYSPTLNAFLTELLNRIAKVNVHLSAILSTERCTNRKAF